MYTQKAEYYDYALYIGRFQPFHNGHLASVRYTLSRAKQMLIIIGGYKLASSPMDPWTTQERKRMILSALSSAERKRIHFIFIRDRLYNEELWKENVVREVQFATKPKSRIAIFGHNKDATSYYLKLFPQWPFVETGNFFNISATDVRSEYFLKSSHSFQNARFEPLLPNTVARFLKQFRQKKSFQILKQEYDYASHTDVRIRSSVLPSLRPHLIALWVGAYLLITKRHTFPGKNLFSLPLMSEMPLHQNYEQFCIKRHTFHHPKYDVHGKDVSFCKIQNSIDFDMNTCTNEHQQWILLDELPFIEDKMFEDHYQILKSF